MRKLTIVILLFSSIGVFAQNLTSDQIDKEIKPLKANLIWLESDNLKLKNDIGALSSKLSLIIVKLDSLQRLSETNSMAIKKASTELGLKIITTETNANQKITEVDKSLSKTSLIGIIGVLLAFLLSIGLYRLVSKRQSTDKSDIIDQLSKTKSSIEESLVKEFGKQTELMEIQLQLIEQQKTVIQSTPNVEPDHSLALKVADEITLIGRNISLMDKNVKGIKQLLRSVQKLKDNLSANGYDLPELLDKKFNEGMKLIIVNSVADENLQKGDEIISKIIKPQVNYNNRMIQPAQVEVSVG